MGKCINRAESALHCTNCIYKNLCTPFEKLLYTENIKKEDEEECICFIDINGFNNEDNNYTNGDIEDIWSEMGEEDTWKEMSWNKYKDNLFNYIEDN